jgi:hypothetical protein
MMTPRERVFAVIAGDIPDKIPFVIWNNKMPGGELNDQLLKNEVCVVIKSSVWSSYFTDINVEYNHFTGNDGQQRTRTTYHTSAGNLSAVYLHLAGISWQEEYLYKSPEDFTALELLIASRQYVPTYDAFLKDDGMYPGQSFARPATIHSPMHEVIYELMGIEAFSFAWMDNNDEIISLCNVMADDREKRISILADSPAQYCVIDGNTEINVIGGNRYEEYYLPYIKSGCNILHKHGKYVGAHLDGENRLLAPFIKLTSLDFIESFTPPPDCNYSITEALQAWPDKTLILNFPSSIHLKGADAVLKRGKEILTECKQSNRVIMGISEDMPPQCKETLIPLAELINCKGEIL